MCGLLLTADDGAAGSLVRTALLLLLSVQLASLWRREQLLSSKAERGGGRWRGEVRGGCVWGKKLEMRAASLLLLIAGRGSVDGAAGSVGVSLRLAFPRPREAAAGEAVSRCWREWNRLGEGRGRWGYGGG